MMKMYEAYFNIIIAIFTKIIVMVKNDRNIKFVIMICDTNYLIPRHVTQIFCFDVYRVSLV